MSEWLASLAPYIIVAAICLLAGAALGNYTAHRDYERITRDQ